MLGRLVEEAERGCRDRGGCGCRCRRAEGREEARDGSAQLQDGAQQCPAHGWRVCVLCLSNWVLAAVAVRCRLRDELGFGSWRAGGGKFGGLSS